MPRLINPVALVAFLLIGLFSDWGNAFWALAGYCLALLIAGWMIEHGQF